MFTGHGAYWAGQTVEHEDTTREIMLKKHRGGKKG